MSFSWDKVAHSSEVNCEPLPDVSSVGTPRRAIQCKARAFTHVVVCASTSGIASGHLMNLSTTVNSYRVLQWWERAHYVDVDVNKTACLWHKLVHRCGSMSTKLLMYICCLTTETSFRPDADLLPYTWPHKLGRSHSFHCLD